MFSRIIRRRFIHNFRYYSEDRETVIKELLDDAASFQDLKPTSIENTWSTLPYAEGTSFRRDQSQKLLRPKTDPTTTSVILFPGQGSQYVGMAKDLVKFPGARDIFEFANEMLRFDLLKMCLSGPRETLDEMVNSQLAVMVTSLAALEKLKEERPNAIENCVATTGFSLGEITALVFAGSIPLDRALRLVQIRGEAMRQASEQHPSGMATVLYGPDTELNVACKRAVEWCLDNGIEQPHCSVANYLYPHCKVIGGNQEALRFLESNAQQFKIRRIKKLSTIGAFHTGLMESTVEPISKALRRIQLEDPAIPVLSNIDGHEYKNVQQIIRKLPKQLISPVKWEQTLHILYERKSGDSFPRTFECGPGKGLKAILKQVNAKAWDSSFNII